MRIYIKICIAVILMVIMIVPAVSCSEVTALPYAFEGTMQAGIENAPPVEVIMDTDFPAVPSELPVYTIVFPNVDDDYAEKVAQSLGFQGKPVTLDPGDTRHVYSYENKTGVLEIGLDGSITIRGDVDPNASVSLPSEQESINIAQDWLTATGLFVEESFYTIETAPYMEVEGVTIAEKVQMIADVAGYPITGAGVSLVVGDNGRIIDVRVYEPTLEEFGTVDLKKPEQALDILRAYLSSPSASPPEARECHTNMRSFSRLSVTSISIEYRINGSYVQPVFVIEGDAYDDNNPGVVEKFRGLVDAVVRSDS